MKNGTIVLIRHAAYLKPVPGAYYGQSDLPLTQAGEAQAIRLAALIKRMGFDIKRAYCSDLMRARRTAELALPDIPAQTTPKLREASFGAWEGKLYREVRNEPAFEAFANGGAPLGGEAADAVAARVLAELARIVEAAPDGDMAIVAHAGPIRLIIARLLGLPAEANWRFKVDMASISAVTLTEGYAYLSALNIAPALFDNATP